MIGYWYYKFLIRHPCLVISGILVFSLACIIVSLTTKDWPDFSQPTLGFEARGTEIGKRITAWRNLQRETGPSGKLVANPDDFQSPDEINSDSTIMLPRKKHKKKKNNKNNKNNLRNKLKKIKHLSVNETNNSYDEGYIRDYEMNETDVNRRNDYEYGRNMSFMNEEDDKKNIQMKKNKWMSLKNFDPPDLKSQTHLMTDGFFCQSPDKEFSHLVIERTSNSTDSLLELNALLAMCQLEQQITETQGYEDYCQKELLSNNCCKPWSIPNYIALLSNKTSCFDIEQNDVLTVQNLLFNCYEYFNSLKLDNDCQESICRAPVECTRHNAVFNILYYLTDVNFMKVNDSNIFLKHATIFVPIAKSTKILQFFHALERSDLKNELIKVVAMDLGLKNALFDENLLSDGWLVGLGVLFVMMCMWIYTSSIFVTVMTILAVVFSLGIAYFIYNVVFDMTFFPFMNLLAVVILIGVGADDAFIFVKIWQCMLAEKIKNGSPIASESNHIENLSNLMAATLRHSAMSMFVTSLTTAGAFFASFASSITAIKCFGIFAGTAIISNYFLMVTWLPASVSFMERIPFSISSLLPSSFSQKLQKSINQKGLILENGIMAAINNLSIIWILLFGVTGIISCVLVFYWPRLQLPESQDFRLFASNHPFELYDTKFKDKFWFEKSISSIDNFRLPLRFVWGILPIDDGDYTDPNSKGNLHFDNNFNISTPESQIWLLNFCRKLKMQSFYQTSFGLLLPNCFIENFISWMNRRCIDAMDNVDRTPCCETSKFPFETHVFNYCLIKSISSLYATPREYFMPGVAGPKFAHPNPENNITLPLVKALVIEYESNVWYSVSYTEVNNFTSTVQTWFENELKTAPTEMKGGWFISELDFFDLQDSLSNGTIISIIIAMSTSLIVLFMVTLNVLISIYAAITVFLTILTTIAVLILLEWKLNILESVSVSTAIGLAVDFSLHYGIQYCFSSNSNRAAATAFSLSRIIGPTAMAAVTTGAAGAVMLPSNLLPYIQIGIFLVVVMTVSWLYSTFFLMSLLRLIGPEYKFLQFEYPNLKNRKNIRDSDKDITERRDRHTIVSKQLLTPSGSAVGDLINSESHELDSLTSNSLIKQINTSERSRPIDNDRIFGRKSNLYKDYRSPSTGSAITVVLPDDPDLKI